MDIEKLSGDTFFNQLRRTEYARLDHTGHVYLDYTGGNLHPRCLSDEHHRFLQNNIYGNPHSENPASQSSGRAISQAREAVLKFFNAEDYHCIFTANASAALQIVGECYPFSQESHFLLTADNHNSVNGIREYCKNKEGSFSYCGMNAEELTIDNECLTKQLESHKTKKNKLFAFPAQSNASGVRHSLSWIKKAKEHGWDVLLDAAAFVPTSRLDLTQLNPDFVCLSFYKMFGYPTGVGCLLVKRSAFLKLEKRWFAGGTVSMASVNANNHFLLDGFERFENGTVNYLGIPAITSGLNFIDSIGREEINNRIRELTGLLIRHLSALRHDNGRRLIKIYGPKHMENRGGSVMMNFFDAEGRQAPCQIIEEAANKKMISLRTGCFCNPGIDEINSHINAEELSNYFETRINADYADMVGFLGKLRGAIRVSVGVPTTTADIATFIKFAETFINKPVTSNMLYIPNIKSALA
jgi:selenocysteine lyase/cysteine desulfurase